MRRGARTSRGAGKRGRSASVASAGVPRGEECLCGTCGDDVRNDPIGCVKCEQWVHGKEMCSGLPQELIGAIMKYEGKGIQFMCMKCQVQYVEDRGKPPSSHTEPHLAETVSHYSTK